MMNRSENVEILLRWETSDNTSENVIAAIKQQLWFMY